MPVRALAALLLLSVAGWPPVGPPPDLSAAYPNPVYGEDEGEFVVLDVPEETRLSAYELSDGEDTVRLPNVSTSGELAFASNGTAARLVGYRTVVIDSFPSLSNTGETIVLRRAGDDRVVDTLHYAEASEATLHTDIGREPLGSTDHEPATARSVNVTTFVLPDDPRPIHRTLGTADRRILLAGYTLTSERVVDALLRAAGRGVTVRVLLDGAPVGGDTPAQVRALDRLSAGGVDVRLIGGPRARYAFHHAKYAVVDDSAIVLTENWKASGTGGHGNRGWGIIADNAAVADSLAAVFRSDADRTGAQRWPSVREPASRDTSSAANETYPRRFPAGQFRAERVTLAVTPDNAESVVTDFIGNASRSLRVQQVSLGDGRFGRLLVDAAERGVRVELLLSGKWYVRDENRMLADCLNGYAERADIPLSVRVVAPRSRFEKVHAKVAVADDERVLLGSLNWNEHALERNREVIVVATGQDVARYYGRVFRADWRGGAWRVSWSTILGALLAVLGAAWWLRGQFTFDDMAVAARKESTGRVWTDDIESGTATPVFADGSGEESIPEPGAGARKEPNTEPKEPEEGERERT